MNPTMVMSTVQMKPSRPNPKPYLCDVDSADETILIVPPHVLNDANQVIGVKVYVWFRVQGLD